MIPKGFVEFEHRCQKISDTNKIKLKDILKGFVKRIAKATSNCMCKLAQSKKGQKTTL